MMLRPILLRGSLLCKSGALSKVLVVGTARAQGAIRTNMYTAIMDQNNKRKIEAETGAIFDEIDMDKDGFISKTEFVEALNRLNYYELVNVHKAAHANMEEKLKTLAQIERGMEDLAKSHSRKQEAYSNVGMMTGAEIDALFAKSKNQKQEIHTLLGDLKELIGKTSAIFATVGDEPYNNVGMTTASEIDSLFVDDQKKKEKQQKM